MNISIILFISFFKTDIYIYFKKRYILNLSFKKGYVPNSPNLIQASVNQVESQITLNTSGSILLVIDLLH